jgi:ribonuclease D
MTGPPPTALPPDFPLTITREALVALPIGRYPGRVQVVSSDAELADAMRELRNERVVGFDTETRPAFRVGERYAPSLVQLATAQAVYLFQVQQHDCSTALEEILSSPRIVKAGVSVRHDLQTLKEVFPFAAEAVVDLGSVAKRHRIAQTGVRSLAALFLGLRIPKGGSTSNWAATRLSRDQIVYAATDAWVCRTLYLRFKALGLIAAAA